MTMTFVHRRSGPFEILDTTRYDFGYLFRVFLDRLMPTTSVCILRAYFSTNMCAYYE